MLDIAGEVKTNSKAKFSNVFLHMHTSVLANQQRLRGAVSKTSQKRWMIGFDEESQGTPREQQNLMIYVALSSTPRWFLFNSYYIEV